MTKLKVMLVAAFMIMVSVFAVGPASATADGSINYTEYHQIDVNEQQALINAHCDCNPVKSSVSDDGAYKVSRYVANNSTFAWDICWIDLNLHRTRASDGSWNSWFTEGWKARLTCSGVIYFDDY